MPMWPGGPNYPWEGQVPWMQQGGGQAPQQDPSQSLATGGGAAPAAAPTPGAGAPLSPETTATLAQMAAKHRGFPVGQPTPVTYKDTISGQPKPDPSGSLTYTFPDGYTVVIGAKGELGPETPPKADTTTTIKEHPDIKDNAGNTYTWDTATNGYRPAPGVPTQAANPDEDRLKSINAQVAESQRNERQANEAAGKGYLTDNEVATIRQADTRLGQSQQQIDLDLAKFGQQKKQEDTLLPGQVAQQGATLAGTQATTAETQARTGQIQSAVDIAGQKAPGEIALTAAQTAAQQATAGRTAQETAQANVPGVTSTGAGGVFYTRDPNTGAMTAHVNQAVAPKTMADVAQQVGLLQSQATAQKDQLAKQVASGALSQDAAAKQFSDWWGQNVEPQKAMLGAAQQQAALDQQKQIEEQNRLNLSTAQAAGQTAVTAQQALLPYAVGPDFGKATNNILQAFQSGKAPAPMDYSNAFTFQAPDMNDIYQKATAAALAHISPTAAGIVGGPGATPSMFQNPPDVNQQLNMTNYGFAGAPPTAPAPAPVPAAAATPAAPAAPAGGLPPGWAGVPGLDPRLSGQLNPQGANPVPIPNYQFAGVGAWS